ncbi:hypothetical protein CTI12_AA204130 [Artemisia annua]|uniref:Uncharacterized protein n=1 Tax=Artemisia annua TaxID=35608 RepID=A0A2U1P1M0_ARTAN|nr:hypothetical protein CTI12_AA204130 [Artemisia annua]
MDEYQSAPSSFTQPRPSSYINDDYEKNQATYVKPPSYSDNVPTRPVSHVEHEQRDLVADDGHANEKSPPSYEQVAPKQPSYYGDDGTRGVNQDHDHKAPSFQDVGPGRGTSIYEDYYENRDEKPATFGAVRPPNDSSKDEDSFVMNPPRPLSYRR